MTMAGPDPILLEIMIAFCIGGMAGATILGLLLGLSGFAPPHCGVCICP